MRPDPRIIIAALSAAVILAACFARGRTDAVIEFFAVGQGDAALVSCGGTQMLIDGGPDRAVLAKLGRAMPFLDRRIEYVVLTHPHGDHFVGLIAVLERYDVGTLLLSGARGDQPAYALFEQAARASRAKTHIARAGDRIDLGCARAEVFWPDVSADLAGDPNDASVVLRVVPDAHPASAALFMADAGGRVEERLAASADLRAEVLKVGHHGSRSSTSRTFLDAVGPRLAVISVGKNTYGHPAWAVLARLRAAGAPVLRTDHAGDIRVLFRSDGPAAYVRSRFGLWRRVTTLPP